MAANIDSIWTKIGTIGTAIWTSASTANVKSDGTGTIGTDMLLVITAGADGSFLSKLRAQPSASVAATSTTATILRVYLSTKTTGATTRTDTFLHSEFSCPSQSACNAAGVVTPMEVPLGFVLPTGMTLLVSMHHAAAANTSWQFISVGGDY